MPNQPRSLTLSEENAGSTLDEDTLLHGETLLVISSSDSEDVALVVVTEVLSVNFVAHSLVEERTAIHDEKGMFSTISALHKSENLHVFLVVDFDFLVSAGKGVRDVKLYR